MSPDRIHIHIQNRHLTILIPVKKNKKLMTWVLLSSIPWIWTMYFIVEKTYKPEKGLWWTVFTLLLILAWASIGVAGYTMLSFMFFGREKIHITPKQILVEKPLVFYNRRNYYLVKDISNLKASKELYQIKTAGEWVEKKRSVLRLDYPNKKVVFGRGITQTEAEWILLKIAQSNLLPTHVFAPMHQI